MPSLGYILILFNTGGEAKLVLLEWGVGHGRVRESLWSARRLCRARLNIFMGINGL